jgi:hypothetical protein
VVSFSYNAEGEQVIYQQSRPVQTFWHQRLRSASPPLFRFVEGGDKGNAPFNQVLKTHHRWTAQQSQ